MYDANKSIDFCETDMTPYTGFRDFVQFIGGVRPRSNKHSIGKIVISGAWSRRVLRHPFVRTLCVLCAGTIYDGTGGKLSAQERRVFSARALGVQSLEPGEYHIK